MKTNNKMLRGRESLIRLVGKRRRFLPNRSSILSSPVPETCINLVNNDEQSKQECAIQSSTSDWVTCPVCGRNVRGEPYSFNSHLDTCLTKGKKRKLTQRTLLQFNFSSKSEPKVSPDGVTKSEAVVVCEAVGDDVTQDAVIAYCNSDNVASPVKDCRPFELLSTPEHVLRNAIDDEIADPINDEVDLQVDCLPDLKNDVLRSDVSVSVDDMVGVTLETFIVGRKFSTEKELSQGACICLSRDPNNSKDPNAVKVLLGVSTSCKALGFIPRDLAQYLSPLIEKYNLIFEGHLTSIPESSTDIVPIQIACRNTISHHTEEHSEIQAFTHLWKNVLHVVESGKNRVPNNAKYQQNFGLLIQEVLQSSSHLFTEAERSLLESFFSLSNDGQRLFVRLYTRKGPWFRTPTFSYAEVVDHEQAIKELCAMGYLCSSEDTDELQDDDVKKILNLLTVPELRDISCMFNKNSARCMRKQDLIASLSSLYGHGTCSSLLGAILERTGPCVKISCKAESLIWRAERLFFINGEQDLSAFLLVDLGIVKYPTYRCIISKPIFSDRCDLLAYEEAIEVAQIMDESLDANDVDSVFRCMKLADSRTPSSADKAMCVEASESRPSFLSHFSASWVYSKVIFLGVSFLERERRYKEAVILLKKLLTCFTCDGRRGIWTLRLSIDLEHMGYPEESLSVAEDGLQDQWVRAGFRMALQRGVLRLAKPPRRWKVPSFSASVRKKIKEIHIQGRPLNCEAGVKSRFYGEDGEQCAVEQLALQYYAAEGGGWQGVHTESGIWLTIFGLLMWDIIFSEVPNVFYTRFQTAPLDLETDSFYPLRKRLIEPHLERIHDGMAEEILIASWESHMGTGCRGVNWDWHSLSELRAAVACVGGPCLASLCRHLAQDYRSWSSGMPDLLLWRFSGEYRGEAKLVEVKGPRDRLSEQQRAWLLLLTDCGFNTEVCKVSPLPLSSVPHDSDSENN